ncbi:MAG: hypothetical protein QOI80_1858 [Solirubrobacteraceae bacterium]|nr:hypothetical protein [Solirubrobacteraceae bacterium]
MNEMLARTGALFLAPPPPAAATSAAALPPADLVAVVADARHLDAVAGGVAAELRHRLRARTALVCRPGALLARPATPAARGLARRLCGRDVPAVAAGAVCRVALPPDAATGVRDAWRAITAAAGLPAVVALPGRAEGWDVLLGDTDHLVLAAADDADPAYIELALGSLAGLGPAVDRIVAPAGLVARRAAALGLLRLRPAPVEAPA